MKRFRDWKEKALKNPKVVKEYLRLVDEENESLEKELATAKAENGRLVEAVSLYLKGNIGVKLLSDALSTSNALDYWQGEIRKAEVKWWAGIRRKLIGMSRDGFWKWIEGKSRQSNKSKGEREGGGIKWTPEKRKQYEDSIKKYTEIVKPIADEAARSTKLSAEDLNKRWGSDKPKERKP